MSELGNFIDLKLGLAGKPIILHKMVSLKMQKSHN